MRRSDLLLPVLPHFVAFAWQYRARALCSLPRLRALPPRAWTCSAGALRFQARRQQHLPGSWGTLSCTCPALRPRRDLGAWLISASVLPSAYVTASALAKPAFEAQSRGLHTPCVRFAARITPLPRNTRFRLVASLCRAGFPCWVPLEGFCSRLLRFPSSFSRLCLAHDVIRYPPPVEPLFTS